MRDRINAALKDAVEANDRTRACTLRLIVAAIKDRDACQRGADDGAECVGSAQVAEILCQMIRQREASIRDYEEAGRLELAEQEREEIAVIREFLPKPMSEDETQRAVEDAISASNAKSLRDLGAVMGKLKSQYAGRMDFCKAGAAVRSALG